MRPPGTLTGLQGVQATTGGEVERDGPVVQSLLVTSIGASSPELLLDAQLGDYAGV